MTKKILALFLAFSMLFTMCGVTSVFAAEDAASEETASEPTGEPESEPTSESTEDKTEDDGPAFEGDPIEIDISSSYKQGTTVVVKGVVNDPEISLVNIQIESDDDDVFESIMKRATADEFEGGEYSYSLKSASAGATYTLTVSDNSGTFSAKKDFVVTKSSTSVPDDNPGDNSGKVTIWIDGYTERYVDKQTIALDQLYDAPTVLSVAEYLLEEVVDRKYRLNTDGSKIERIATTATGSTYLRDRGTTNLPDAEWMYFVNGRNYPESMKEKTVKSGDEIVIYYGVPGVTGYPKVTVSPTGGLSLNDYLEVSVEQQITNPDTFEVTSAPLYGARVYLFKRNATKYSTYYTTNRSGVYKSSKISSSFISSYQGGSLRVAYYSSSTSSKVAPYICSKDYDFVTERTGYTQASVAIEGAYNTILEPYTPTSSARIEEYDLYNYALEVFDLKDVDIEYEVNSARNNFTYLGTNSSSRYYSHDNGDITSKSAWYVTVNGMTFGPNDNLKEVEVYTGDEIIFYFGDSDTKYIYYNIDDTLTTGSTVKAYFYYDDEFTEPVSGLDVYFDGSGSSVRYRTDSNGMVKLPAVDYRGTYELQWGEHIVSGDNYMPEYVYRLVELTYTGTAKPNPTEPTTEKKTTPTSGRDPGDFVEIDDPTEPKTEPWEDSTKGTDDPWENGDVIGPNTNYQNTPSKHYPDTNIDAWAVANIDKAYDYGLMSGTTHGYFEPLRGITRAEFTAVIARILGLDTEPESYSQVFADVSPSDWCYGVVMAAYSAGYVQGTNAVTFSPATYITREEMAVLISRIIGNSGNSDVSNFADSAYISSWAASGVAAVNSAGLMTGDQFGQFLPKDYVNRQTAATVAVRLYEYLRR